MRDLPYYKECLQILLYENLLEAIRIVPVLSVQIVLKRTLIPLVFITDIGTDGTAHLEMMLL